MEPPRTATAGDETGRDRPLSLDDLIDLHFLLEDDRVFMAGLLRAEDVTS